VKRRYEESKSDKKSEAGLIEDYSSETSSDREGNTKEGSKEKIPVQPILVKPKIGFKLDISKCKIDYAQEIGVEISISFLIINVEGKVRKKPVISDRDSKSSMEKETSIKNSNTTQEYEVLLSSINEILGLKISPNDSVTAVRSLLTSFIEKEKEIKESHFSQCNELKTMLKTEKENHEETKKELKRVKETMNNLLEENKQIRIKIEKYVSEEKNYSNRKSKDKLKAEDILDSKDSIDESKNISKLINTIPVY